jgi:hypothetical protein
MCLPLYNNSFCYFWEHILDSQIQLVPQVTETECQLLDLWGNTSLG